MHDLMAVTAWSPLKLWRVCGVLKGSSTDESDESCASI